MGYVVAIVILVVGFACVGVVGILVATRHLWRMSQCLIGTANARTLEDLSPRRTWFILAYPAAYAVAWVVMVACVTFQCGYPAHLLGTRNFFDDTTGFTVMGLLAFPVGILACFVWSSRVFANYSDYTLLMWIPYLVVIIGGLCRPSWRLLYVFVGLTALSIAGCQTKHMYEIFSGGFGQ